MRLLTGLTVVGGVLVIAGLATGLVGETARLAGGRGWQSIVVAAEGLVVAGMSCGAALFVAVAAWQLSIKWRQPRGQWGPAGRAAAPAGWPVERRRAPSQRGGMPQQGAHPAPAVNGFSRAPFDVTGPQPPDHPDPETAARAPAQQKMTQIKDLYREAEQMGDAEFTAHWEDLRRRQHELIRQYFEQAGLGGADVGHNVS